MAHLDVKVKYLRLITGVMMWCFPVQRREARLNRAEVAKIPGGHRERNRRAPDS
jgi:hypothetical protein